MTQENQLKQQLDRSCDLMYPVLEQQIKARVNLAQNESKLTSFRLSYALAPLALLITVWFGVIDHNQLSEEELALYEDLELLIAEDELGFLEDMDVSDWDLEPSDDNDA